MKTAGKFYISLNDTTTKPYYWNQLAQNWTSAPADATFFDTKRAADDESKYADEYGPGEAVVMLATKDVA